jgi:lysophospholipase
MKHALHCTVVLLSFLFTISLHAAAAEVLQPSRNNPHRLSTEENFAANYAQRIAPWFAAHGEQGTFTGVRGVKLHYRKFMQPATANEKGAIVISSGRTEGLIIYPELIYDLWNQGYSVYIHDHRGQGLSGGRFGGTTRGDVGAFDDYVADLKTFVDTKVSPAHRKLFLLAHSMGGGIASVYLERNPGKFDAAVLVSPMHDPLLPSPITGKERTAAICGMSVALQGFFSPGEYAVGQQDYTRVAFEKNDLTHSSARWEQTRNTYDQYRGARVSGPTHRWIREACSAANYARRHADELKLPILLIQSGDDTALRNPSQAEFCSRATNCTLALIPNARHALFIERDDFRLPMLNRTLAFLDTISRR